MARTPLIEFTANGAYGSGMVSDMSAVADIALPC
jgi:hypothetical protein